MFDLQSKIKKNNFKSEGLLEQAGWRVKRFPHYFNIFLSTFANHQKRKDFMFLLNLSAMSSKHLKLTKTLLVHAHTNHVHIECAYSDLFTLRGVMQFWELSEYCSLQRPHHKRNRPKWLVNISWMLLVRCVHMFSNVFYWSDIQQALIIKGNSVFPLLK